MGVELEKVYTVYVDVGSLGTAGLWIEECVDVAGLGA